MAKTPCDFIPCLALYTHPIHAPFLLSISPCPSSHTLVYPIINNVSSLTEVNVSRPATLVCLTTGFPLPSITWQKEGEEVMVVMDGRISTFTFDIGNRSSSFESSGNGSIGGLLESITGFNTHYIRSLGELGVMHLLSFDRLVRGDTANYTCTATNMLPQTTTLTVLSPSISLVVLGKPGLIVAVESCIYCTLSKLLVLHHIHALILSLLLCLHML